MLTRHDIAGLFMTHYSDRAWDDAEAERERVRRAVSELGVAGYCVFGGEVERTRVVNAELAEAAGAPLLVASDLEQGLGQQLEGGAVFPSHMAIGATGSTELAGRVGHAVALGARSVGINVIFAPVADLATEPSNPIIGVRSFGADPDPAAALTGAYVRGCQSARVAATAKHFPGHGDTAVDSHIDMPVVDVDRATLDRREFVPFREAIASGVKVVMAGHVAYAALAGPDVPATFSALVCEELLRGELGFDGLVVTDALLMGAVVKRHGSAEAAVKALTAGADLLLMPEDLDDAIDGVAAAVASGTIPNERVSRSLERIADLKTWLGASSDGVAQARGCSGGQADALAREVAGRAVTLVSNTGSLPIGTAARGEGNVVVAALIDSEHAPDLGGLPGFLEERLPGATLRTLAGDAPRSELDELARDVGAAGAFVLLVFDHPAAWRGRKGPPDALISASARSMEVASASVVVVFAGPELVPLFRGADAVLCCYDGSQPMQEAALDVLVGRAEARGSLPAPVPD